MRRFWVVVILLGALLALGSSLSFSSRADNSFIRGEYVEVRTASVFAGACHYNGELMTAGRDALMAWHVTSGEWNGVDLTGASVVVVVSADDNLSNESAARRSEIIIDERASHTQAAALL